MKTYLAAFACIGAVAALLTTGGCVSREDYNKVMTMNRRANEQLQQTQAKLRTVEGEKAGLSAKLSECRATVAAKQREVALLESKNGDLQSSFDKLRKLYEQSQTSEAPRPLGPIVLLPTPIDQALRGFAKDNPNLVEYLPNYGMVKFKSDFTFEKGSDKVSAGAKEALAKLVEILNTPPAGGFNVYIAGHTDDIPIKKPATLRRHPTNWYLSVHRAVDVEKVLTAAGLAPKRIGVMGFGEYHPIAPNAPGHKGNAKNRRVEIWIVPPGRFLTESPAVLSK